MSDTIVITSRSRNKFSLIGLSIKEVIPLATVVIIGIFLAFVRYNQVYSAYSLEWDSATFLSNAAVYSGYATYAQGLDPTKPPVVPFILSIMFRFTGPNQVDGYLLSSTMYFLAIVGCFLLSRQAMPAWLATFPAASFAIAPFVLEWSGIVLANVEGVAVAALALATFLEGARNRRPSLFIFAIPLFVLASITQFSMSAVLVAAVVYLAAERKLDWILDNYEFYYGCGLSMLVFAIFATPWIAYPLTHHTTISVIFPRLVASGPLSLESGTYVYALQFPSSLGAGVYGYLLLILFLLASTIIIAGLLGSKALKFNSFDVSMFAWFMLLFLYYVLVWPAKDPRYSVEYAMPAIILAFSTLSKFLDRIRPSSGHRRPLLIFPLIFLIVIAVASLAIVSATQTVGKVPVPEVQTNEGIREAVLWFSSNQVPATTKIESNWYTLFRWYGPQYNCTPAPLASDLQTPSQYTAWSDSLSAQGISYVVYVDPTSQVMSTAGLTLVWTSSEGNVAILSYSSGS